MASRYAVIMAGGRGERFWPLSTSRNPKQLLALTGEKPLISLAADRLEGLVPPENVFVVTNADLVEATRAAAPQLPPENVVGEPMGRDTAAAVACGAALVEAAGGADAVFAVLTADQVIGDLDVFRATLRGAMELAQESDILLTIGIRPTEPATGFGYVEAGESFAERRGIEFREALRFVEKPDADRAREYLQTGRFYWNSGMFVWSVDALKRAFALHCPEMAQLTETLAAFAREGRIDAGMAETYPGLEKISVDYALMEKAENIVMACGAFSWDDVGSWPALENHFEADPSGNVRIGTVETLDSEGNVVFSKGRLTALIGVKDLVVVQAEGVTLVCPKDRAQEIKRMVTTLRESGEFSALL